MKLIEAGREPVATGHKLVATQTDAVATQTNPVATGREPVATQTDPIATGHNPIATERVGAFSIQNALKCIITIQYIYIYICAWQISKTFLHEVHNLNTPQG
jgi:hypothetical protein